MCVKKVWEVWEVWGGWGPTLTLPGGECGEGGGRRPKVGGIILPVSFPNFWSKKLKYLHPLRDPNALNVYISVIYQCF
ncbi:hypothetical protein CYANOKiyG1_61230 [Okeania sp. KiyG1]|nr:hypothetical protein CYANOKiyG1_61230 [Okeania sp. KiyG1]